MRIKNVLFGVFSLCAAALWTGSVFAADYPAKPIRMLLGFSVGGSTDFIARYYATKMTGILKTPVLVINRAGGSQLIAIRELMSSAPDGYTLFLASASAMSQGPGVRTDLPYDAQKDFTHIALIGTAAGVIVCSPSLPVHTIGELVKYAKDHPDKLNYGSSGVGSASHLQTEYLLSLSGIKMTHIPYKGDSEIMMAIAEGSAQLGFSPVQGALPAIKSGRVRALAVTGSKRLEGLPDVPALSESDVAGLGAVDTYTYYVLLGPKDLPKDIVDKVNAAANEVSRMPDTITLLHQAFLEPTVSTPESSREFVEKDTAKWKALSKHVTFIK